MKLPVIRFSKREHRAPVSVSKFFFKLKMNPFVITFFLYGLEEGNVRKVAVDNYIMLKKTKTKRNLHYPQIKVSSIYM